MTRNELIDKFNKIADKYRDKGGSLVDLSDQELYIFIAGKTLDYGRSVEASLENAEIQMKDRKRAEKRFGTKHEDLLMSKSKYTKRWRGKDGRWHYEYGREGSKKLIHEFDAHKENWESMKDADKKAIEISKKNPKKYITVTADFHMINITEHPKLPTSAYAPDDFKKGYWKNGKHFDWSEKRKTKAATVGFGVSD